MGVSFHPGPKTRRFIGQYRTSGSQAGVGAGFAAVGFGLTKCLGHLDFGFQRSGFRVIGSATWGHELTMASGVPCPSRRCRAWACAQTRVVGTLVTQASHTHTLCLSLSLFLSLSLSRSSLPLSLSLYTEILNPQPLRGCEPPTPFRPQCRLSASASPRRGFRSP